jgi:enamine deaminase RidA (YjgF/YER057c/UK114 family)
MSREALQPDGVATPAPPFSQVVVSGDLVVTAGQVAFDVAGELVPGGILVELEAVARRPA